MPCVELADDADPDEDEMPLNAKITGKKTAKIVDHKDYKKAVIMNAEVKVRKIKSIESNDKMWFYKNKSLLLEFLEMLIYLVET